MKVTLDSVRQAAKHADLNPHIANQLRNLFLNLTDPDEQNNIDEWLHASAANDHLFDMLCVANKDGTGEPYMDMITKMAKRRVNPFYRYWHLIKVGLLAIIAILMLDYFIPTHPLSRLVYGADPSERMLDQTTVTTDAEARTIWLADSTRIDLQPYSMARYPNELSWASRRLTISGSATIAVRGSLETPFKLEVGDYTIQTYKDALIRCENNKLTLEALHP